MNKNHDLKVEKIADLARLEFNSDELNQFVPTFEEILGYFKQLESVDTAEVRPTFHAVLRSEFETPYRSDRTGESLSTDDALSNAPDSRNGQFRVPKVIE